MYKTDIAVGVGLFAFGAMMAFVLIPLTTYEGMHFGLPPTFFPTLLSIFLMAFSVCLIVQSFARLKKQGGDAPSAIGGWNLFVFAQSMAIILCGVLLIDFVGLFVGAPFLIAALMLLLGERNFVMILATATVPVAALFFVARYVLIMPLP